jgi:AraC family transcriptional regulator, exoenzyme S synthesis regulatory protein ExsA
MTQQIRTAVDTGWLDVAPMENQLAVQTLPLHLPPMLNALESIRSNPIAKRFEIGELLFAQFSCPAVEPVGIWTQTDYLIHLLSGTMAWKDFTGAWSAEAGQTVYFKKGVKIVPEHSGDDICLQLFFIPDAFVRETVMELAADLPPVPPVPPGLEPTDARGMTIRVNNDIALSAFFHAMTIYFAADEKPPEALLKLKLKELLTSILVGQSNQPLSAYLRYIAACDAPPIEAIMEMNFCHNLSIDTFARMCHRSLSSFKREFRKLYGTSPGKWLLERRLEHSATLLQTTGMSVTEIMFECGFEELSHFSKAFKGKFGQSPSAYREVRAF